MKNSISFRLWGRYALFTDPVTKIGGEKCSYHLPTYEAVKGVLKSIYWKPSVIWHVDRLRVMKHIQTQTKGTKPLNWNGGNSLAIYTFLHQVEYQVLAHFEWNPHRPELAADQIDGKHYQIARRMLERGGRQDVFLGVRDCPGYVEPCEFGEDQGDYDGIPELSFGLMFELYANRGPFGLTFRSNLLNTTDEEARSGLVDTRVETDLVMGVHDLLASFRIHPELRLLTGVRYIHARLDVNLWVQAGDREALEVTYRVTDDSQLDYLVGINYNHFFTDRWGVLVNADYAVAGDNDRDYSADVRALYQTLDGLVSEGEEGAAGILKAAEGFETRLEVIGVSRLQDAISAMFEAGA